MKVALLYEHPTWSDKLIQTFAENDIELTLINIDELVFETTKLDVSYDILVNRVNIMPSAERAASVVFHTLHFLRWLELTGVRVINGAKAHFAGASKAVQNGIFASLGLDCPSAVAIYKRDDALAAAENIGFPLIVKPNIGGSGSGVAKYNSVDELQADISNRSLDLGIDNTGLVQEYIEADGFIYRVEILGDQLFYSIRQKMQSGIFNYCTADGCHSDEDDSETPEIKRKGKFDFCAIDSDERIQVFEPSAAIVEHVISIVKAADADLGGVEYLIDQKTGQPCFYDFNPYSNFVSRGDDLLGFSPEQRFVEFVRSVYLGSV